MPDALPDRAILAEAEQLHSLCAGLPVIQIQFEDGTVSWTPRGRITGRGSIFISAEDGSVKDTRIQP